MKALKIFVVGGSTGYANWLISQGETFEGKLVSNMADSDLVLFTGGGDVHPSFYKRNRHPRNYASSPNNGGTFETRDQKEIEVFQEALIKGKAIFGTCRGLQLSCVMAGGDLIQDLSHPGNHPIQFYDGTMANVTSLHHQMIYPFEKLKEQEDYFILANSLGLSSRHEGEELGVSVAMPKNEDGFILEPECAFFPKINAFGHQGHLEMMHRYSRVVMITRGLVDLQVKGELNNILLQKMLISDALKLTLKSEEAVKEK